MHRLEIVVPMNSYLISSLSKVYRYDKKSGKHIEVKQSINSGGYYNVTSSKIDRVVQARIFGLDNYQNDPLFSNFVVEQVKS